MNWKVQRAPGTLVPGPVSHWYLHTGDTYATVHRLPDRQGWHWIVKTAFDDAHNPERLAAGTAYKLPLAKTAAENAIRAHAAKHRVYAAKHRVYSRPG